MAMHDNPRHRAWTVVPLAAIGVFAVAFLAALWDLTAHSNRDAAAGLVLAPIGALSWAWVYRQIRRDN